MKKLFILLTLTLLAFASHAQYNFGITGVKISEMPQADSLYAADKIPIVQNGVDKQLPYSVMKRYNPYALSVAFSISQTGTSDPQVEILFNEFTAIYPDITWTWIRLDVGSYQLSVNEPVFIANLSCMTVPSNKVHGYNWTAFQGDFQGESSLILTVSDMSNNFTDVDDHLEHTLIVISVYQ
jgi:hypothetical protein